MKKILYFFLGMIFLLVVAAFALPIIFKDDIKAAIDKKIAENLNAQVNFKADDFSVNLFQDFPNLSISQANFSIVGKEPFLGDTLMSAKSFRASLDIMSVITGDEIRVNGVYLDKLRMFARVNKEAKANWDIVKPQPTDTTKKPEKEPSKLKIAIKEWKVTDAMVVYDDKTLPTFVKIEGLNHKGKGNLDADLFDLITETTVNKFSADYAGTNYMDEKKIDANVTLGMDMKNSKYTFKENKFKVNDFELNMDGFIAMPDTNIQMDIKYKTLKNEFKTLLSLVPGAYSKSFEKVKTAGTVQFDGDVKGVYNAKQMPGFHLNLKVADANFQYPDLPTAVTNIALDLKINNDNGVIDETLVDLQKFHMDLGANPVDARLLLKGLTNMDIDADVKAKMNLADVMKMFPVAGLDLRGLFNIDAKAKGIYNAATKAMPSLSAGMTLVNGYVKSSSFPQPLENLQVKASASSDGTPKNSQFNLEDFKMVLENEPFEAHAFVSDFDDINFKVKAKGAIDLTKITKIYPLENMKLSGRVSADLQTEGKKSYIDAKLYDKIPTSGTLGLQNFVYETKEMPAVKITNAKMSFTPKEMILSQFDGFAGKSDMHMEGTMENYMAYIFKNETIKGQLNFKSDNFDVNEWMKDAPTDGKSAPESAPLTVVPIPLNVDFLLHSSIKTVKYDKISMDNMHGDVIVKDGTVRIDKAVFNTLGGEVSMSGVYDAKDIKNPAFDFDFGVKDMVIKEAAKNFITVAKFAPLAEQMIGKFTTKFKLKGGLGQDMMPLFSSLTGGGLISVVESTLSDVTILNKLADVTKLVDLKSMKISDLIMKAEVKDGRVSYEPFDVKAGQYMMNISGSGGLDGTLGYLLKMDVPAGAAGVAANQALSQLTGQASSGSDKIPLNINVGGNYKSPTFKIGKGDMKNQAQGLVKAKSDEVKKQLTQEFDKAKDEAQAKAKAELDKVKAEAEAKAKAELDKLKNEAENKIKAEIDRLANEKLKRAADSLRKIAEDKAKGQLKDQIKNRIPGIKFP